MSQHLLSSQLLLSSVMSHLLSYTRSQLLLSSMSHLLSYTSQLLLSSITSQHFYSSILQQQHSSSIISYNVIVIFLCHSTYFSLYNSYIPPCHSSYSPLSKQKFLCRAAIFLYNATTATFCQQLIIQYITTIFLYNVTSYTSL